MQVKRTEKKFILNSQERVLAQKSIGAVMPKDRYCVSADGYEVRSLYFDTFSDRACAEKEEGLQEHEKIRARIYGTDDCIIKLESKRKNGECDFIWVGRLPDCFAVTQEDTGICAGV